MCSSKTQIFQNRRKLVNVDDDRRGSSTFKRKLLHGRAQAAFNFFIFSIREDANASNIESKGGDSSTGGNEPDETAGKTRMLSPRPYTQKRLYAMCPRDEFSQRLKFGPKCLKDS